MSDPNRLIYPTIDLFLYDLAEGLGQQEDKINQSRKQFWQKVYGAKTEQLLENLKKAEEEASDYIELLGEQKVEKFVSTLNGNYYPVKVGDTYALQVDCSGYKEPEIDKYSPKPVDSLATIQEIINKQVNNQPGTIGQSWLIWGKLPADDQDATETAKNCYKELKLVPTPKWDKDLKAEGKFLGANFYELWLMPSDRGTVNQNHHVLICLFDYNQGESIAVAGKTMTKLYPEFLQLFRFRNKVIWAYHQSRHLKSDMKQASQLIQKIVSKLPEQVNAPKIDLKELQQNLVDTLTILSTYANYISRLEEQQNTIKSNLTNYQIRLKTIAKLEPNTNSNQPLDFLESFSDFANEKYLPQIEADRASLSAGLRLLENAIKTIEGIIEIEQTKSDRALNQTIFIASTGLAASGITATLVSTQVYSPQNKDNTMTLSSAILWSIGIPFLVIVSAIIFFSIPRFFRPR
ncbi:MAG TPA: hypothetical protein VK211_22345 [Kamptonema sp.]|nr:hypothetical protein [Kamptonema sp.]